MKNRLSMILLPKDASTGEVLKDDCDIRIVGVWQNRKVVRHRTGFYLVCNLPLGSVTIRAKSRTFPEGDYVVPVGQYTGSSFPVSDILLTKEAPTGPTVVSLTSLAVFSATIRGLVTDDNDVPLFGATVLVETRDERTTTNLEGRFELNLHGLEGEIVQIRLQVRMDGYGTKRPAFEVTQDEIKEVIIVLTPRL